MIIRKERTPPSSYNLNSITLSAFFSRRFKVQMQESTCFLGEKYMFDRLQWKRNYLFIFKVQYINLPIISLTYFLVRKSYCLSSIRPGSSLGLTKNTEKTEGKNLLQNCHHYCHVSRESKTSYGEIICLSLTGDSTKW